MKKTHSELAGHDYKLRNSCDKKKNWIFIFPPILILTALSSLVSLLTSNFYFRDSVIIAVKSHYLDLINLSIIVPIGIFMFILAIKKSYWAKLFILGIMTYLTFMFARHSYSPLLI